MMILGGGAMSEEVVGRGILPSREVAGLSER